MGNNHDYIALDWVKGEIKQTLSQAQKALEVFVENKDDMTQITFCLNYVHQVHGTLQMVEFYGAALLAEEMETLCQCILESKVSNIQEALEVLMESLLQLENYLEHIQKGQRDLPVVLLPILNDLRVLQGRPLLSDTSLFTPNLAAADVVGNSDHNLRMQDEQVLANLRKLRQMFQFSLAGVIRNQDLEQNFTYLYRVVVRLEKFCLGTSLGKIWWVAVGFLDAIQGNADELSSATKHLLRELDYQIKLMIEESDDILEKPLPSDLLKNLLYYVARTSVTSPRIEELKIKFNLSAALLTEQEVDEERQKLQAPGQETMSSVVSALSDELNLIKDQLDLYVRDENKDNQTLAELIQPLTQVANTIAVLGLGISRKMILDQVSIIENVLESGEPANDKTMMEMAGALLYVEANLDSLTNEHSSSGSETDQLNDENTGFVVPAEHFESAHNAVIYESRNGLEQAKNSIVNFIASQWDHAELEGVPNLLDSIRGGLQIIPLPQAAALLQSCSQYIEEQLLANKSVPDWQALDRLADAISSIEYYMERLSEGAKGNERILQVAEESVAKLGYPTSGEVSAESEANVPVLSQYHVSDIATESPDAVVKESDENLIDDEILEIFLEEAAEVIEEIKTTMTKLRVEPDDQKDIQTLRRAFHTLKGSGRLVGALAVADVAWPVENLLNKYLEANEGIGLDIFDLLDAVMDQLPILVGEFAQKKESSNYEHLAIRAEMLLENKTTSNLTQPKPKPKPKPKPEPKPEPIEASTVYEIDDDDDLIDEEILEIFIEEAGEVLEAIHVQLPVLLEDYTNNDALSELRRAFHTLKGSGRMVGALVIGDAAWAIENLLNRIIDGSIIMNKDIAALINHVIDNIPALVECFETRTKSNLDVPLIEKQAEALANGDFVSGIGATSSAEDYSATSEGQDQEQQEVCIDDALLEIFENEAALHVKSVENFASVVTEGSSIPVDDDLSRALHTLKGSANTANIQPIAVIAVPVEKIIKEARAKNIGVTYPLAQMLLAAMVLIKEGVEQLASTPHQLIAGTDEFLNSLVNIKQEAFKEVSDENELMKGTRQDPQIINIFLTEGLDILLDAEGILNEWNDNPVSEEGLVKLFGEVKTLHRGAKVAGLDSIAELCECLEECYGSIDIDKQIPEPTFLRDIKRGHDALINMMDQLAAGLSIYLDNKLLAELREHIGEQSSQTKQTDDSLHEKLIELENELDGALPSYTSDDELLEENDEHSQTSAVDNDDDLMDAELAEIFLEEANEIVHGISPALAQLKKSPNDEHILVQLQRDLHTLKGAARLAGVEPVGDLADILEKVFELSVDSRVVMGELLISLLEDSGLELTAMLLSVEQGKPCQYQNDLIEKIKQASEAEEETHVSAPVPKDSAQTETKTTTFVAASKEEGSTDGGVFELDPELAEIFLEEANEIIHSSGELLHRWEVDTQNINLVAELQRELHTLKGGARMAEVDSIGDLAHELETLFELIVESRFDPSSAMITLCLSCHDALANMVDCISEGRHSPTAVSLLEQIKHVVKTGQVGDAGVVPDLSSGDGVADAEVESVIEYEVNPESASEDLFEGDLLPLFIDESKDILSAAAEHLEHWRDDEDGVDGIIELQREMHTLKGGARLADVDAIGDLADAMNYRLEQLIEGQIPDHQGLLTAITKAYQELTEMLESLIHGTKVQPAPKLILEVNKAGGYSEPSTALNGQMPNVLETSILGDLDDIDAEVIEMFAEEARELIDALEEQISEWSNAPNNEKSNLEIQRILHTLKGGARLSNISGLADESHELEARLLDAQKNNESFTGELKQAVLKKQDVLLKLVDEVQRLAEVPEASNSATPASTSPEVSTVSVSQPQKTSAPEAKKIPKATQKVAPQETIRVSSDLLESLVNLAGETSISRGRLEQQISDFGFTLEEMSATIERLREQLRRMDMETEAQVLFTAEKEGVIAPDYSDFDPLEMDRYSSIQQLSRALTESTSDLLDLRDTLSNRARDAETLLLQQSRINSELQEGLMKTRMIPFSSILPRLRRIVRQIGGELDKQVEFDALNVEGEMDRSVLERMVAPLEHMLRNALDHGIESAVQRKKSGKPESGQIILSLMREGGNIVLKMKDDGAGVNEAVVLKKAVSQGLVDKKAKPTHQEIIQFIMLPGFSTAEKVTQISGRGVGMDVVASEIKQMGGTIEIDSTFGKGTEFTVRLPFTVSVNRALMVNTGEDFYAIPLNSIEGIVRVSPYELEEYYKPDAPMYEYAGREYNLQYLGKLLHSSHHPKLQGQPLPLPVILVRGTDKPMALQVDSLMGSREIVVKSLGSQFANVHGASGATILGDGSVVVILDLPALIRDDNAGLLGGTDILEAAPRDKEKASLVMVIDDSVTVRKVTTRLLERNGYEVITAKDGVDAIATLQDFKPDIMLLDIEMPRMDGFEVATLVRHDERLQDVPIIMITSRTGQKHKDRAFSIGVNGYLGKPFQEHDLLENIEKYLS
jgi:chemosensory pili system protein ChpA (sensor histidine kinase/response regulator)